MASVYAFADLSFEMSEIKNAPRKIAIEHLELRLNSFFNTQED